MNKNKATHEGHCQACGRIHKLPVGRLAKHGYTVECGFFNGVCPGAEELPLEQDRTFLDKTNKALREYAARQNQRAADLRAGKIEPRFLKAVKNEDRKWGEPRYIQMKASRHEIGELAAKRQIESAALEAEIDADRARVHADYMETVADRVHGAALTEVKTEPKAGAKVHLKKISRFNGKPFVPCSTRRNFLLNSTTNPDEVTCKRCRKYADKQS